MNNCVSRSLLFSQFQLCSTDGIIMTVKTDGFKRNMYSYNIIRVCEEMIYRLAKGIEQNLD